MQECSESLGCMVSVRASEKEAKAATEESGTSEEAAIAAVNGEQCGDLRVDSRSGQDIGETGECKLEVHHAFHSLRWW